MEPEGETRFTDVIEALDGAEIRFLIIGRRAVILYGAPVLTADYHLWIHPADKKRTLSLLQDELGFELSHSADTRRPIVTGFSGMKKYDLLFFRRVTNIENEVIDFEACNARSVLKEDAVAGLRFRIPSIEDLIRLKKVRPHNVKDEQDISYLLKAKSLLGKAEHR